jgi:hypothetical protein
MIEFSDFYFLFFSVLPSRKKKATRHHFLKLLRARPGRASESAGEPF